MAKETKVAATEEKVLNVPLRSAHLHSRRVAKTNKAVSTLRLFVKKHTRASEVKVSQLINDFIWSSGAKNPPSSVKVKVSIDSAKVATVRLPSEISLEEEKKKFIEEIRRARRKQKRKRILKTRRTMRKSQS